MSYLQTTLEQQKQQQQQEQQQNVVETRIPDPKVVPKAKRLRFTAEYKLRMLQEVDACPEPGQIGALLRREGLYSSHLSKWRRQRQKGQLRAVSPRKRGRKRQDPLAEELAQLGRDNERWGWATTSAYSVPVGRTLYVHDRCHHRVHKQVTRVFIELDRKVNPNDLVDGIHPQKDTSTATVAECLG